MHGAGKVDQLWYRHGTRDGDDVVAGGPRGQAPLVLADPHPGHRRVAVDRERSRMVEEEPERRRPIERGALFH